MNNLYRGKICYGVDIQDGMPVVVRGTRNRCGVRCERLDASDAGYRAALRAGVFCAGSISTRESLIRRLEAPYGSIGKACKVFPTLLDIQLPFPLDNCVYSFLDVARVDKGKVTSLAVAARKDDVEKSLRLYAASGVDPAVLDHEGLAIWTQSLNEIPASNLYPPCRVIICPGKSYTTVVFGRGDALISAHGIKTGDEVRINRLLQAQFAADDGQRPEVMWVWCGTGACDDKCVNELYKRLNADWPGPLVVHDDPEAFLARALAVRVLQAGQHLGCNIRIGQFAHDSIVRLGHKRAVTTAMLFLISGLLLCGIMPVVKIVIDREKSALDKVFGVLAEELAPGQVKNAKGKYALGIIRPELEKERKGLEPFRAAFRPSLREKIISIMDIGKRNGLRYKVISLSGDKIEIVGSAEEWNCFSELLSFLNMSDDKLSRKNASEDERIPFVIRADNGFTDFVSHGR